MENLKKIIRKSIYLVFYCLGFSYIFKYINRKKIKILMYHGVCNQQTSFECPWLTINTKNFEKQIRYLSRNYKIISLYDLVNQIKKKTPFPSDSIVITFDDGFKNNYIDAFPVIQKYKIKATIFLTTDYIDTPEISWVNKVFYFINNISMDKFIEELTVKFPAFSDLFEKIDKNNFLELEEYITFILKYKINSITREKFLQYLYNKFKLKINNEEVKNLYLSWKEIKEMDNYGISFGSHTSTHAVLIKLDYKNAENEVINSKKIMEKKLNKKVDLFSYPFGDHNSDIKKILAENNFLAATSSIEGFNNVDSDLLSLKRVCIFDEPFYCFHLRITGLAVLFERIYQKLYGNLKRNRDFG